VRVPSREDDSPPTQEHPVTANTVPAGTVPTLLPTRPMLIAGGKAALAAVAGGLAVLVLLTLVGWITAPHVGLGGGLVGTLQSAACSGWWPTTSR